ncbi:SPOR domain-containing protein [Saccharibacter floricola]|uniref:SPOR domain-containing protein n=1 Tax=Saccharibacter floricola DSM 15669 TaxID=1123227 RepID=A0ABQ0NZ70_9PROT|nr:SPOR domain-containing protein [Saccharibacter floricola]GBQ06932.1 hypothetical protein AA15669_1154 [Saccharibacter floricola DSM 15669]
MDEQDDKHAEAVTAPRQDERLNNSPYADGPRARLGSAPEGEGAGPPLGPSRGGAFSAILGHDPATRKLMGFALALVAVLLLIAGIWSLIGNRHQGIPVIGPPAFAVKDRPTDPGGMQIMSDDTAHSDVTGTGAVHLAPPPEQPDARLLAHREETGAQPAAARPAGEAVNTPSSSQPQPQTQQQTAAPSQQPSAPAEAPSSHVASPVPPHDAHKDVEKAAPKTSALSPPVAPQAEEASSSDTPATDETSAEGRYQVQLGALDSQAKAEHAWASFQHKAPDIVGGHTPRYQAISRNGKNFVRLRIGGFANAKAARHFCARLHAQSLACAPVAF